MIKTEKEPPEYHNYPAEDCIFCQSESRHWHLETNRPVCKDCSKIFEEEDIPIAEFNYTA